MNKKIDPWDEISGLIALEKKTALDDFRRREFIPGALPTRRSAPAPESRPAMRRTVWALAASILFVAGLTSLWLLKGSWGSMASAPALAELLSDSYFYSRAGSAENPAPATVPVPAANPRFAAWVEAGLGRSAADVEAADPRAPVERGNPAAVQRKMEKIIRENTIERMLAHFCQLGKEA